MSGFEFNERGMRELFERSAANLEAADRKFRETHTGLPYDVVRVDVVHAFPDGVELGAEALDDYAAAVSAGDPVEPTTRTSAHVPPRSARRSTRGTRSASAGDAQQCRPGAQSALPRSPSLLRDEEPTTGAAAVHEVPDVSELVEAAPSICLLTSSCIRIDAELRGHRARRVDTVADVVEPIEHLDLLQFGGGEYPVTSGP